MKNYPHWDLFPALINRPGNTGSHWLNQTAGIAPPLRL